MQNKFGFILVKPQLGENIGACARSMKNFGFTKLHVVSPKINFPNNKAKATSVGAYDIISNAKVFNESNEAVSDFDIIISFKFGSINRLILDLFFFSLLMILLKNF